MTNLQTTCFTDEELALHALEEYLEEGEDRDEMEAFIEEHGHKNFYCYFDEYREMVKQYDQETVIIVTHRGYATPYVPLYKLS